MNHIERALKGNNFYPWYILVVVLSFLVQVIVWRLVQSGLDYFATNSFDGVQLWFKIAISFMDKNVQLIAIMLPMSVSLFTMLFLIKRFHRRSFAEVVNGTQSVRWKRIFFGFLVWFVLVGVGFMIEYLLFPENFTFQFQWQSFIPLLLISIIFIPLQATFEELLFRGYLAQGIGSFTQNRLIALFVPALLFAFLHMGNPEVSTHGLVMFFNYLAIALIWGVICIFDDGIEISMGMHIANNLFISLFSTTKGAAFETDAVFEVSQVNPYYTLVFITLTGLLAVAVFYKKYHWHFGTLTQKIENPTDNTAPIH